MDEKVRAAHQLLKMMPPSDLGESLMGICKLSPDIIETLLPEVDQPLKTRRDDAAKKNFVLCDYNRDGDCFRSPWTNKYTPELEDGWVPDARLRAMEEKANTAWEGYRDLYYDAGGSTTSVYMWDVDDGFAAAFLLCKDVAGAGQWNSIHVANTNEKTGKVSLSTTIMLGTAKEAADGYRVMGSVSQSNECALEGDPVVCMGKLIQTVENRLRSSLDSVYFGKTKDVISELRSVMNNDSDAKHAMAQELMGRMKKPSSE
eukprot:PhM_4_TR1863/c0_g2_i1/m.6959/K10365/CAPZB; capping protein (actin filament) muscle Z-line, beta